MLLPLIGWALTGAVFLIKPGYSSAYEQVHPKQYPLDDNALIIPQESWMELRLLKTILGVHLLVKTDGLWQHLNIKSLKPQRLPTKAQEILLLSDAIKQNPKRYGRIVSGENGFYMTSTGVTLNLNWNTLTISQEGKDTWFINTLYKIHYLQWLGHKQANAVFGTIALMLLALLVIYGVISYLQRYKSIK